MSEVVITVISGATTSLTFASGETAVELTLASGETTVLNLELPGVQGPIGVPSGLPLPVFTEANLTYSGNTLVAVTYPSGEPYDYVALTYSGGVLSEINYRDGGISGVPIASYALVYSGSTLLSVVQA